uniref:Uncharacterized protein n=1 Tax=Arundo donax TaxID=35708 RepID=A0A0A9HCW4_ARUDO
MPSQPVEHRSFLLIDDLPLPFKRIIHRSFLTPNDNIHMLMCCTLITVK